MTLTAVAVPLAWAFPETLLALLMGLLAIGWARVSLSHHYPLDLALGTLLALGVAWPVVLLFL
jgi:membrane-associated phospholipid phosphatase